MIFFHYLSLKLIAPFFDRPHHEFKANKVSVMFYHLLMSSIEFTISDPN